MDFILSSPLGWIVNMSLENTILLKVVTQLWKHVHTSDDFQEKFEISEEKCLLLEDICLENIEKLPLPNELLIKLKKLIKPIGIEIIKFHLNRIGIIPGNECVKEKPINLFWTIKGTVDTKRTFQALIDDESLDLSFRYRLACYYCLENDISILWNQMPDELKYDFTHGQELYLTKIWCIKQIDPMAFTRLIDKVDYYSLCYFCLTQSVQACNKDAAEYFWNELSEEARSIGLPKLLGEVQIKQYDLFKEQESAIQYVYEYTEVLDFLLRQVDNRSLEDTLSRLYVSSDVVLNVIWHWRCQEDFLEILDYFVLPVGTLEYDSILRNVVGKIYFGFQDYDYGLLLKALLKQESKFQKQCDKPIFPSSFDIFYYFRYDSKAISLIASYCKSELKRNVLFSQEIFENLSDDEEWDFLTFVFDVCILKSKQEIFRSACKVPFMCSNFQNLYHIQNIHKFIKDLTREKVKNS